MTISAFKDEYHSIRGICAETTDGDESSAREGGRVEVM